MENINNNQINNDLRALDARLQPLSSYSDADVEHALREVRRKVSVKAVRRRIIRMLPLAAAVAALLVVGTVLLNRSIKEETVYRYANVDARPLKVSLPDGTEIWLRAGSELEYDRNFNSTGRQVRFSGEGYFDVATNPEMPFFVVTPSMRIKVLGTIFNLVDKADELPEIVLAKGSVMMQTAGGSNLVRLKSGQRATWNPEDDAYDITEVPVGDLLLVNYGIVSLKSRTADQIAGSIEEAFGVRLEAEGSFSSEDRLYDFSFEQGASPESVVDLLNFICKDRKYVIVKQ
ncbi:MAG: FecR domain-containing protein [Bacteroidales bacterium]|nr:FecR domain-containing protein [Bacteroidales bacterium]